MRCRQLILLFLLSPSLLWAQDILQRQITLNIDSETPEAVLRLIETESKIPIFFQDAVLPAELYSLNVRDQALGKTLTEWLSPLGLGFEVYQNQAIIVGPIEQLARSYNREYFLEQYQSAISNTDTLRESAYLFIGEEANAPANGMAIIKAVVLDADSDSPVEGARITVVSNKSILRSDAEGEFVMQLPLGDHFLRIETPNYSPFEQAVRVLSGGEIEFALDAPYYSLDEVELSARSAESNLRSVQPGIIQLSMNELREVPTLMGEADIIKGLLVQPGISTVGEGATGFNVRGGNIDQNLIMQDGGMVFNSSHILGFFSIFNADAIEGITLYKGHIPAQYGGRVASVLDVETKEGNYKKLKGSGGLGLISARMMLDGPIVKDKTSFTIGVRSFFPAWAMPLFEGRPEIRQSSAFFVDGNFKIDHRFSPTSTLSWSNYASYDFFRYAREYGFDWTNQMSSLVWRNLVSSKWSSTTTLTAGNYESGLFNPDGPSAFTLNTGIRNYKAKQQFLWAPNSRTSLFIGGEGVYYQLIPQTLSPRGEQSAVGIREIDGAQGLESAAYANLEFSVTPLIGFSVGLRYSSFHNLGPGQSFVYGADSPIRDEFIVDTLSFEAGQTTQWYGGFEPRVSARFLLDESSSIKLSYGRHRQYVHLISNTSAATPVDIWQLSDQYIQPQISDNFSLGYFKNFGSGQWETSIDFYYRDISSVVEYKDLPTILLNEHLETELIKGEGRAYGTEFSLKRNVGVWQGEISYTFSRSLRRAEGSFPDEVINEGNWYASNFDSPHNVNIGLRRKVRKSQLLSINFVYRSGRPITAPIGDYRIGAVDVPHFSPRNLFRIPDYHRLDLAYTFKPDLIRRKALKSDFTIAAYNLYFRKNPFSLYFRKSDSGIPETYRLAILGTVFPSFTWNFRF
ncbi:MAG: TonB-dependent receptor plug domain-containing protein [Bacteroidia bacterium]